MRRGRAASCLLLPLATALQFAPLAGQASLGPHLAAGVGWHHIGDRRQQTGMAVLVGTAPRSGELLAPSFEAGLFTTAFSTTQVSLRGALYVYPGTSGFFLKGAGGVAFLTAPGISGRDEGVGLTVGLGVGWDIRPGRRLRLRPYASVSGSGIEGTGVTLREVGLGISW